MYAADTFPKNYEKVHDYCQPPHPFLILANFFPASKKKDEKPVFKKTLLQN